MHFFEQEGVLRLILEAEKYLLLGSVIQVLIWSWIFWECSLLYWHWARLPLTCTWAIVAFTVEAWKVVAFAMFDGDQTSLHDNFWYPLSLVIHLLLSGKSSHSPRSSSIHINPLLSSFYLSIYLSIYLPPFFSLYLLNNTDNLFFFHIEVSIELFLWRLIVLVQYPLLQL